MDQTKYEPRLATLGGGTGLSALLRGLKKYTPNLTAIVTVTDDGGSSGALRRELGVLPPGDIRSCLVALSEEENLMARLFQYRFPSVGALSGHSFGNLFLTAMSALTGGFDLGIARSSEVLAIRGQVLPVTLRSVTLQATLENGRTVQGESNIGRTRTRIRELNLYPSPPPACPAAVEAIAGADGIVIGPGSLYTSVIANLLVDGIVPALRRSRAPKIYVCNIMTQPGETAGYTLRHHLEAIEKHAGDGLIDYVVVNNGKIPARLLRRYSQLESFPVTVDRAALPGARVVKSNLVSRLEYARHDSDKLAAVIFKLMRAGTKKR
ncbi:MAG: gluconeogenesis factor YvcK family protein [Endomicrobiales bacterium]